jgi:hypothetical protein
VASTKFRYLGEQVKKISCFNGINGVDLNRIEILQFSFLTPAGVALTLFRCSCDDRLRNFLAQWKMAVIYSDRNLTVLGFTS